MDKIDAEFYKGLGKQHLEEVTTPALKPHIYLKFYPKSKRSYWRVEGMPRKAWLDPELTKLWNMAHSYVYRLNNAIGAKIYAEQLAKKGGKK